MSFKNAVMEELNKIRKSKIGSQKEKFLDGYKCTEQPLSDEVEALVSVLSKILED